MNFPYSKAPSDEGAVAAFSGPPKGTLAFWGEEEPLAIWDLPLAANPGLAMRAPTRLGERQVISAPTSSYYPQIPRSAVPYPATS